MSETDDRFYMSTRYPDIAPGATPGGMPGHEDAAEALDLAREISTVVRSAL